ncbi:MAG: hypothetical protein MUC88_27650 [Planctomycetes bacterium]|nr:hypothetical protein [Planctomycetota bacterium]
MSIAVACLFVAMTCSCHDTVDHPTPELSEATTEWIEAAHQTFGSYVTSGTDSTKAGSWEYTRQWRE